MHSGELQTMSDVIVCLHPTNQKPSIEQCTKIFTAPPRIAYNPNVAVGRVFPEFEPDGKTRVP